MTPVMFFQHSFNPEAGIAMALSNMYMRLAIREEMLKLFPREDKVYSHANSYEVNNVRGYAILTTGHQWQLVRVDKYLNLEKSVILEGRNQHRSLHHDEEMVEVVLGMLDYCLELPQENVRVLEKAYQYLDERKYMLEGEDDSEMAKNSWLSKKLLTFYKKRM
jgi:hypothetical protein